MRFRDFLRVSVLIYGAGATALVVAAAVGSGGMTGMASALAADPGTVSVAGHLVEVISGLDLDSVCYRKGAVDSLARATKAELPPVLAQAVDRIARRGATPLAALKSLSVSC